MKNRMGRRKFSISGLVMTGMLCLLCKVAFGQEPDTWHTYRNEDFNFVIEFPGMPDSSEQTVNSAAGLLTMHMYQIDQSKNDSAQNIYYSVIYTRYPDSLDVETLNIDTFYTHSIKGMLTNLKSDLMEEKVVYIGGYEGRELRVDFQKGLAIITERLVFADRRYYLLMVVTENEKDRNLLIQKFFDSFQLLPE